MKARPLIIVSYHFAPSPAVGGKRFSFLAREFGRLGYDVHVIANEHGESRFGAADSSLPFTGAVHRVAAPVHLPLRGDDKLTRKANSLLRKLMAPVGVEYAWAGAAARKALEIAGGLDNGVVIATSPPHAALIAGDRIARRLGWPLVLDYRDPWSAHDWPEWKRGRVTNALARRVESALVARSAARVLNTPAMRESFERFFPLTDSRTNFVIPNGFDALPAPPPARAAGPIELVHAGEIFRGRSLVPVLRAARALRERHPGRAIHLTNYGELPATEWQRIRAAGLESFVTVLPRVPFETLRAALQAAHLLLAVVGDHMLYSTPYKVYDYMAAGRPILGLAPAGASLFALLDESGAGICVQPNDEAAVERALETLLFEPAPPARAHLERFHWSNLALQYRMALETVARPLRTPGTGAPVRKVVES